MTGGHTRNLFALIEDERDDFPYLLKKYRIDVARDLRYSDLSRVKFGKIDAPKIDLTGCNLEYADLSEIPFNRLVLEGANTGHTLFATALPPNKSVQEEISVSEAMRRAVLSVETYHNPQWQIERLIADMSRRTSPVMMFYDTISEQDHLTRQISEVFRSRSIADVLDGDERGIGLYGSSDFLAFYTRSPISDIHLSSRELDKRFLGLIDAQRWIADPITYSADDIGRLSNISDAIKWERHVESRRDKFCVALARELKRKSVVLFSGFPPMSRNLYKQLQSTMKVRFKFVFLCSHNIELKFREEGGKWRREAIPSLALDSPVATAKDVQRLIHRAVAASNFSIHITSRTRSELEKRAGAPLRELKKFFVDFMLTRAQSVSKTDQAEIIL